MKKESLRIIFFPPEGSEFRECVICKGFYVRDDIWNFDNCIWCEIHKKENEETVED